MVMMALILGLFAAALLAALLFGVRTATLALIAVRPSCDKLFDWIKEAAGQANGPGAALNLFILALAVVAIANRPRTLLKPPVLAWVAVMTAALLSMLHSSDPAGGIRLFLTLLTYAAATALPFALIDSVEDVVACLKAALISSILPGLWGVLMILSTPSILLGDGRLESTFMHPNILAFYLVGVMTLILFAFSSRLVSLTQTERRLLVGWLALLLILLLATKTRSAWIAAAIILSGYAVVIDRRWLLGILLLPFAFLIPGVADRLLDLGAGNANDAFANLNSLAWRQLLWSETWQWLSENPSILFGHGLDLYAKHVPLFFSLAHEMTPTGAHNAVLQIFFEMGATGLVAFAVLFISVLLALAKHLLRDFAGGFLFVLLTISHILVAYSDNLLDYLQFQWFFWFAIGTIAASTRFLPLRVEEQERQPDRMAAFPG